MCPNAPSLLHVEKLSVSLSSYEQKTLVHEVSFSVPQNTVLAIVGESGSGKTLTARAIMRLFPSPSLSITGGSILWKGQDLTTFSERDMRRIRGNEIAYIPQAPMSALNPMMTIGSQLTEGYQKGSYQDAFSRACGLLHRCGFSSPRTTMDSFPHELSGGMKQRVVIAMALMNSPSMVIADEPTTALDVSLQAEVLSLLTSLVEEEHMSLLFITHDLGVVARVADHVIIMRQGRILESQDVYQLFSSPENEYTRLLIESSTLKR